MNLSSALPLGRPGNSCHHSSHARMQIPSQLGRLGAALTEGVERHITCLEAYHEVLAHRLADLKAHLSLCHDEVRSPRALFELCVEILDSCVTSLEHAEEPSRALTRAWMAFAELAMRVIHVLEEEAPAGLADRLAQLQEAERWAGAVSRSRSNQLNIVKHIIAPMVTLWELANVASANRALHQADWPAQLAKWQGLQYTTSQAGVLRVLGHCPVLQDVILPWRLEFTFEIATRLAGLTRLRTLRIQSLTTHDVAITALLTSPTLEFLRVDSQVSSTSLTDARAPLKKLWVQVGKDFRVRDIPGSVCDIRLWRPDGPTFSRQLHDLPKSVEVLRADLYEDDVREVAAEDVAALQALPHLRIAMIASQQTRAPLRNALPHVDVRVTSIRGESHWFPDVV